MKLRKRFFIILVPFFTLLFWQNCAPPPKTQSATEVYFDHLRSQPKINLNTAAISAKVMDPQKPIKLAARIDHLCLEDQDSGRTRFSRNLATQHPRFEGLAMQSYEIELLESADLSSVLREAEQDPCVVNVFEVRRVSVSAIPNDPEYSKQIYLQATGALEAWDLFFPQSGFSGIGQEVVVAIIDTGMQMNHPDLAPHLWTDSVTGAHGIDLVNNDLDPTDDNFMTSGHGSGVAGVIGAVRSNSFGISGVMGSNVRLMIIKAMGADGTGSSAAIADGISWAVAKGAKVINLSLGGEGPALDLRAAISAAVSAGVFVSAAAGNFNAEIDPTKLNTFFTPAAYAKDIKGFMSVGNLDMSTGLRYVNSAYSNVFVEIGAPGAASGVFAPRPGIYTTNNSSGFLYQVGSSFSTPQVSAAAALAIGLIRSRGYPWPSPAEVENLIASSAAVSGGLMSSFLGGRKLNLKNLSVLVDLRYPYGGIQQSCFGLGSEACALLRAINLEREKLGVVPLKILSKCMNVSSAHADEMAQSGFFGHDGASSSSELRYSEQGLSGAPAGQLIAFGYSNPLLLLGAFMDSNLGHREMLLDPTYQSVGLKISLSSAGQAFAAICLSAKAGDQL